MVLCSSHKPRYASGLSSYAALPAYRPKRAAALSFVVIQRRIDGADIHLPGRWVCVEIGSIAVTAGRSARISV
jgi:hypothetical protein